MKTKSVSSWTAVAVLLGSMVPATGMADSGPAEQIEEVDRLAIEQNQSIQAFEARIRSSGYEAERETTGWPEPTVQYMGRVGAPWSPHGALGHTVQVMQRIPLWGAREARAAPVYAEQDVVRSERDVATVDLLRDLRVDAVNLARLEAQIELAEDEVGLIEDAVGAVEATAPFEDSNHGDFYQLELARERALDRITEMRADRRGRLETVAARIGVETERLEDHGFSPELLADWLIELPSRDEMVEWARRAEPELRRLEARAEVAAAQIELVDERTRPWPQLMAGYSNTPPMWEMDGPRGQMLQFGVAVSLPIFGSRYDLEASQWQQTQRAIEQDRRQKIEDIRGELDALLAQWELERERLQRHRREMAPLARDLAERLIIGMELGERSASEFLMALRQEVDVERRIIDLQAAQLERQMEIQRLTGGRVGADEAWAYPEEFGGER